MAGVKPVEQERTMTPSKHKKSGQDKYKLSYTFYSMSPRSWKPGKSLADAVPSETVQAIETPRLSEPEDPLAVLEAKNNTEIHGLASMEGKNLLSQYSAQYDEENHPQKEVDGNISPVSTTRSLSRVDTWLRDTTLPDMLLQSSHTHEQSDDLTPRPPSNNSPRPSSKRQRSAANLNSQRPNSKQNDSQLPSSEPPISPRPSSKQPISPRPSSKQISSSQLSSKPPKTPQMTSQSSKTPRPSSKTPRPLSRLRTSHTEDGRVSRAIVVDGEDLSRFDDIGMKETVNREDTQTLDQLEWELASQSGRLTADGQISRMSIVDDDQNSTGSIDSHRSFSRMSQQDQGYDINLRLREDELSDDVNTDDEHEVDEQDVKALH